MKADFLDGIDEEIAAARAAESVSVEKVAKTEVLTPKEEAFERLSDDADALFEKNLQILEEASAFAEIDLDDEDPPPEWVQKWGAAGAKRRLRLARAAWLPQKDAPAGFKIAQGYVQAYMKMKAAKDAGGQRALNIVMVAMPTPVLNTDKPQKLFPVQEVDGD